MHAKDDLSVSAVKSTHAVSVHVTHMEIGIISTII